MVYLKNVYVEVSYDIKCTKTRKNMGRVVAKLINFISRLSYLLSISYYFPTRLLYQVTKMTDLH